MAFGVASSPAGSEAADPVGGADGILLRAARLAWCDPASACGLVTEIGADGVTALVAVLAVLRAGTQGTIVLLSPGARALSRDEALLLDAIGSLQRGEPWRAQRAVAEWVTPDLAIRVIALLARASVAMVRAHLRLARLDPDRITPRRGAA